MPKAIGCGMKRRCPINAKSAKESFCGKIIGGGMSLTAKPKKRSEYFFECRCAKVFLALV
jgi:hypothetical protein